MARHYYRFVEALTQPPMRLKLMQSATFGDALGIAWARWNSASSLCLMKRNTPRRLLWVSG